MPRSKKTKVIAGNTYHCWINRDGLEGGWIGSGAVVGSGAWIESDAVVGSGAWIGSGAVVGSGARVESDAVVESNARVGSGAVVGLSVAAPPKRTAAQISEEIAKLVTELVALASTSVCCEHDPITRAQLASAAQSANARGKYAYGEDNDGWYVELEGNQIEWALSEDVARLRAKTLNAETRALLEAPLPADHVVVRREELDALRECGIVVLEYAPPETWTRNDTALARAARRYRSSQPKGGEG